MRAGGGTPPRRTDRGGCGSWPAGGRRACTGERIRDNSGQGDLRPDPCAVRRADDAYDTVFQQFIRGVDNGAPPLAPNMWPLVRQSAMHSGAGRASAATPMVRAAVHVWLCGPHCHGNMVCTSKEEPSLLLFAVPSLLTCLPPLAV
jgi:hypothetical protein